MVFKTLEDIHFDVGLHFRNCKNVGAICCIGRPRSGLILIELKNISIFQ